MGSIDDRLKDPERRRSTPLQRNIMAYHRDCKQWKEKGMFSQYEGKWAYYLHEKMMVHDLDKRKVLEAAEKYRDSRYGFIVLIGRTQVV